MYNAINAVVAQESGDASNRSIKPFQMHKGYTFLKMTRNQIGSQ